MRTSSLRSSCPAACSGVAATTKSKPGAAVAHSLGDFRLVQALEAAGWTDIDEVIDQSTYVVARDRDGALWAIGVAAADGDRRGYIETDIGLDGRVFDRVAFIDPLDTRDSGALLAALETNA